MPYRHRLPRPSHYLPILAVGLVGLMLIPGGEDGRPGDTVAPNSSLASASAAAIAAITPPAEASEPPVATKVITQTTSAEAPPPPRPRVPVEKLPREATQVASIDSSDVVGSATDAELDPSEETAEAAEAEPEPEPEVNEPAGSRVRVGGTFLNVRSDPTTSSARLFVLEPGEPVTVIETQGNWSRIVNGDGETGWAYSSYLNDSGGGARTSAAAVATSTPSRPASEPAKPERSSTAAVERRPKAVEQRDAPAPRYARIGSNVTARAAPSRNAQRLFVLPAGERVKIAETRDGWAHVVHESGVSGWVRYR